MVMCRYFKRKEHNSENLPYYNLGLPSAKIKTANTLNFDKPPNILPTKIFVFTVFQILRSRKQPFYYNKMSCTTIVTPITIQYDSATIMLQCNSK